jgi:hypothetical protein
VRVEVRGVIALTRSLELTAGEHDGVVLSAAERGGGLTLAHGVCGDVIRVIGAADVSLLNLGLNLPAQQAAHCGHARFVAAVLAVGATNLVVSGITVVGGITVRGGRGHVVMWSDVSNPNGANNGSCVAIAECGNSSTLTICNTTVHNNQIHDCRIPRGGTGYSPQAQGVLLGGDVGSSQCTVGVVIRHNRVASVDAMGIRVNNDNYGACVLNQIVFNEVKDWGQSPLGDRTDSGCLYVYGRKSLTLLPSR